MPPLARWTSLHTSVSEPTEPAPIIAYSTNCPSMPALMVPAMTSCAPTQSTAVMAPKTSTMTVAVSNACIRMRLRAAANARCTAVEKRSRSNGSRA